MTQFYHSQFALKFTLGVVHSIGIDKYVLTISNIWDHTEQFHYPKDMLIISFQLLENKILKAKRLNVITTFFPVK